MGDLEADVAFQGESAGVGEAEEDVPVASFLEGGEGAETPL